MTTRRFRLGTLAILGSALTVQVGLMAFLGERAYRDVLKAVSFGWLLDLGVYDPARDLVNSKTFVAPWVAYRIFAASGVAGLKAANAAVFLGLGALVPAFGSRGFDRRTRLLALFLFSFYVGTQRSIVAGELEDHVATLLLGTGMLLVRERDATFTGSLLAGTGFLFKFWVAIFGLGFVVFLALAGRWRRIPAAVLGLGLPFAILAAVDGGGSIHALLVSTGLSAQYSTWGQVVFKCASTGLVPLALAALAAWLERGRRVDDLLLLCLSLSYVGYVVAARDAFAATTMTATCLVFSSPLVAAWLVARARRVSGARGHAALVGFLAAYLLASTTVTALHLHRDTRPLRLAETPEEAAAMFRYNRPLRVR